jgi:hypothetical protein
MAKRRKRKRDIYVAPTYDVYDVKNLDLTMIDKIREAPLSTLKDALKMETELLPQLGLNNEVLEEFPPSLYPFCGQGLYHWQYPNQFSKYLVHLSKYKIESYIEIGVRHGGTFIITMEYLARFNEIKEALGVDIADNVSFPDYKDGYRKEAEFWQIDSHHLRFKKYVREKEKRYHLALIDGEHTYWGARKDFELLQEHANIIVFHDISNSAVPEIRDLWVELKKNCSNKFNFYEFTDQYTCLTETNQYYLGIGVMVDKGWDFIAQGGN